jgi:hypothetical protein
MIYHNYIFLHRPFGTYVAAIQMNSKEAISLRNLDRIRQ